MVALGVVKFLASSTSVTMGLRSDRRRWFFDFRLRRPLLGLAGVVDARTVLLADVRALAVERVGSCIVKNASSRRSYEIRFGSKTTFTLSACPVLDSTAQVGFSVVPCW